MRKLSGKVAWSQGYGYDSLDCPLEKKNPGVYLKWEALLNCQFPTNGIIKVHCSPYHPFSRGPLGPAAVEKLHLLKCSCG